MTLSAVDLKSFLQPMRPCRWLRWRSETSMQESSIRRMLRISKDVVVAYEIPASDGPDIIYPVAAVKAQEKPETKAFLDYINSPDAGKAFAGFGFIVKNDSQ